MDKIKRKWKKSLAFIVMLMMMVTTVQTQYVYASSVLGGETTEGDLRVNVSDGSIYVYRYTDGSFERQYYTYSGLVLKMDDVMYDLTGYYSSWSVDGLTSVDPSSEVETDTSVTTVWDIDDVEVTQVVTLPTTSAQYIMMSWSIANNGNSDVEGLRLYRGEDTYLANGDNGAGFWDESSQTVGVYKTVDGVQQRLSFQAITTPDSYSSKRYSTVNQEVGTGEALSNEVDDSVSTDNGYALEWYKETLEAGDTWDISAYEIFSNSSITGGGDNQGIVAEASNLTFTVGNVGTDTQNVTYSLILPDGWTGTAERDSDSIDGGDSTTLDVTVDPADDAEPGTYEVTLVITDNDGNTVQAVGSVTIEEYKSVNYHENGATDGSVPVDSNDYSTGDTATVLGNTGYLGQEGYMFDGWNSASDGSGVEYTSGSSISIGLGDQELYAQWLDIESTAKLDDLSVFDQDDETITYTPDFDSEWLIYRATVARENETVTILPTMVQNATAMSVNGESVVSGTTSSAIQLAIGENGIPVDVTGADGTTQTRYWVVITRQGATNANLTDLTASEGDLSPDFDEDETSYSIEVDYDTSEISITPTLSDENASVSVDGESVISETTSSAIQLSVGENEIPVVVTAEDGTTQKTYTIVVTRDTATETETRNADLSDLTTSQGSLSPTFDEDTTDYTVDVANDVTEINLTPTLSSENATVTVNGQNISSGSSSEDIDLEIGQNTIEVVVTAQDGTTQKTYTVVVTREASSEADLSDLTTSQGSLSPSFDEDTTDYTVDVTNDVTEISLTAFLSSDDETMTINGQSVTSGTTSGAIELEVGQNTIEVVVTAQDGTTQKIYTVVVTREASSEASLSELTTSQGTLTPTFDEDVTDYTLGVANDVEEITVTPIVSTSGATITVNGNTVESTEASDAIDLEVGENTIEVVVTAQDGVTQTTYTLTVTRASEDTYSVIGDVDDEQEDDVEGATVKIYQGTTQVGITATTDENGHFVVTGVPAGTYNLVITKGDQIITVYIEVTDEDYIFEDAITLPDGKKNSQLNIGDDDVPTTVVDGLNEMFNDSDIYTDEDQQIVDDGGSVDITMEIQTSDDDEAITMIKAAIDDDEFTSANMLDIDISKLTTTYEGVETETGITYVDTDDPVMLSISIPTKIQGKDNYRIYRSHDYGDGLVVDTITKTPNSYGEYLEVDDEGTVLTLYARYFSTYAIAYSYDRESSTSSTGSSKGSSSTTSIISKSYEITTYDESDGGSISPSGTQSIDYGEDVTYTITPDDGYVIEDVLVDGESVGAVSSYTLEDVDASHTISAVFGPESLDGLAYYYDGDQQVFIGFADDQASENGEYIAPEGTDVYFAENPKAFDDISGHWAEDAINYVTQREVFLGTGENTFSPNQGMTRAMFATVIGRLYEKSYGDLDLENEDTFVDTEKDSWYSEYVEWCAENGIIYGVGDDKFEPNREISRQEITAILYRFADYLGLDDTDLSDVDLDYTDSSDISSWASDAVKYCQEIGVVQGRDDATFAPTATATRAEVATMIERFSEYVVGE